MTTLANVSRRDFVRNALGLGGLVLATGWPASSEAGEAPKYGVDAMAHGWSDNPLVFVSIGEDGLVRIVCHRAEMGQGIRTSLPMVVADELEADWERVRVVQAPGDEARFGNQDTDGSRSMRHFFLPMRRCGAAARQMLEAAAALRWAVPVGEVHAQLGEVVHEPSGRRASFASLALAAAALPVPPADALRLKDPAQFRYIGTDRMRLVDARDIVTGAAVYGTDTQLPGLLHAVMARPAVLGGRVDSFDATATLKMAGVVRVVPVEATPGPADANPSGGIAVIAHNTWAAMRGRQALKVRWNDGPNGSYESGAYRAALEAAARQPGPVVRADGDVDAAFARAGRRVVAEYYLPHLAHAPMEPAAATARIVDGRCEVWGSFQSPQSAREKIARRLGLAVDAVTVHVTLIGGAFGRKSIPDFGIEAAILSQAVGGQPVRLLWTREDDLHNDYFHTVSVERLEAGLDARGRPIAWLHRTVAPPIESTFRSGAMRESAGELSMGAIDLPLQIPNLRIENPEAAAHTRIGWFRSVSNIPHAFAVQSFISELAAAAGRDAKEYLVELLGPDRVVDPARNYGESPTAQPFETGRLRRVIELAAQQADWGRARPKGHGLGIAAHRSFVSYVAAVIEVVVDERGGLAIPRVDIAIDCGAAVNPERVRSQLEGACLMGIGAALTGAITFRDGRVQQDNFHQYTLARMTDAPRETRVHIVPGDFTQPLGGVGEPGLPPILPALCNAILAATGRRIRTLPIGDQLKSA